MNESRAVIIGATGLIGNSLVKQLLNDSSFSKITILVRTWDDLRHPKLEVIPVNFNNLDELRTKLPIGNTIFCCIGTTQKKVKGDKDAYRKIDFDIPVNIAQLGIEKGYRQYVLVSAVGANSQSSNFYLRLKGQVEDAIRNLPFETITIFRPSVLIGNRKEKRIGERIGIALVKTFSFLLTGKRSIYKAIHADKVARAMLVSATQNKKGIVINHHDEIMMMTNPKLG